MAFLHRPDGARIYHEVHGDPAAEPLMLLEGAGGDVPGWRRSIPRLAAELRVVAFDHRGNGRSEAPDAPWTMDTFVGDAVALLDHLGIDAAHLYGQSFGGMVAVEIALAHPARVRSMVLAATHPGGRAAVRSRATAPKDRPYLLLYSEGFAEAHPEHVEEDLRAGSGQRQRPGAARRQRDVVDRFDASGRIGRIRVPTLVLHGTGDRLVDPENARALAAGIPGAELILLEGAGHVYHSEQTEAADRAVLGFIRRHRRG